MRAGALVGYGRESTVVKGILPGEFEQVILLALAGFRTEASGREVYDIVTSMTGRDVSLAAVHITLSRLTEKGWVERQTAAPEPGRGGKPRQKYTISPLGAEVLTEQKAHMERLWGRAAHHPLLGGR